MSDLVVILKSIAGVLGIITAGSSILIFIRLQWPAMVLFILKLYTSALSSLLVLSGLFTTIVGLATQSRILMILGFYNIFIYILHIFTITSAPADWNDFLESLYRPKNPLDSIDRNKYALLKRNALSLPLVPKARLSRNLVFGRITSNSRQLLCDLWQPAEGVENSGLALIYLHGSAWYLLDKDLGTRTFFAHLAAQGHVIMDVAYRLAPEANMMEMIHDVKRAIFWIKENAGKYGVAPDQIVLSGGSAGGHLALMAAYTTNDPEFSPDELKDQDMEVQGVISLYGPADLKAMYYHTNQNLTTREHAEGEMKAVPKGMPDWVRRSMGDNFRRLGFDKGFEDAGAFANLFGGHPEEIPEIYEYFSPINYVTENCPPTLIIHGSHDLMAPVQSSKALYNKLQFKHTESFIHIIRQTDHAFDLILPQISLSTHNAIYDIERFLFAISQKAKENKMNQSEIVFK